MIDASIEIHNVKYLSHQQLSDKINYCIIELNLDLGRKNNETLNEHTCYKFANYLKDKHKGTTIQDLDDFFVKISCMELGKVYDVSYSALVGLFKEFHRIKQESTKSNINNFPVNIINGNMKKSFINDVYNVDKEKALKEHPFMCVCLLTDLKIQSGENFKEYLDRGIKHIKKIDRL